LQRLVGVPQKMLKEKVQDVPCTTSSIRSDFLLFSLVFTVQRVVSIVRVLLWTSDLSMRVQNFVALEHVTSATGTRAQAADVCAENFV
jgi:hypothetical protein